MKKVFNLEAVLYEIILQGDKVFALRDHCISVALKFFILSVR
jgi:hypothetical protein